MGLFAALSGAAVEDIRIQALVTGKDTPTGGLVRYAENSEITGVAVTQSFRGYAFLTAGIAAVNENSTIANCETVTVSAGSVEFNGYGGICLYNRGTITDCRFYVGAHPASLTKFGGIAFENYGAILRSDSWLSGAEITLGSGSGGIVSSVVRGTLESCSVFLDAGTSAEALGVGGIAGQINPSVGTLDQVSAAVAFADCRVTGGKLEGGKQNIGGFIGGINPSATGGVTIRRGIVDLKNIAGASLVGGLIGHARVSQELTISECVINSSVSGNSYAGGIVGVMNYTQDNAKFTLEDSACYGGSVSAGYGYAGGFVSSLVSEASVGTQAVTAIRNCISFAAVTALGNVGGAVGEYGVAESPSSEPKFKDCRIYGDVAAVEGTAGGFFGRQYASNLTLKDCIASGAVRSSGEDSFGSNVGGFVGESSGNAIYEQCSASGTVIGGDNTGGFVGSAYQTSFKNCRADGNVAGSSYFAGFVGRAISVLAEGCTATGNAVLSFSAASGTFGGGFAGGVTEAGSYVSCDAYGTVTSKGSTGGFVGGVQAIAAGAYETGALSGKAYFSKCRAYGRVCQDEGVSGLNYGGFVGYINNQYGSAEFTSCEAYGDAVTTSRAGGFVAEARAGGEAILFIKCKAYGDSRNTDTSANASFAAWLVGSVTGEQVELIAVRMEYCESYGNSYNSTAPGAEASGLIGVLECKAAIVGCSSHAWEVVGTPAAPDVLGHTGGIIGRLNTDITACVITGNSYTCPGGIPSIGTEPDMVLDGSNTVDTTDYTGRNPRPDLSCAISKTGTNDITLSFTGVKGITGYVSGFEVSVDGGNTFTQLVYTSADLTVTGLLLMPIPGNVDSQGRLLPQDFTYTISNRGEYDAASVIVRIMFSDGFARIFDF